MTTAVSTFEPRWASTPGDSIRAILERRGWTADDLADELGIGDPATRRLIQGETEISEDLASKLAACLGGSAKFWLTRERQYRESLFWLSADQLAQQMPIAQMVQLGWIAKSESWREQAKLGLEFLDVENAEEGAALVAQASSNTHYRASDTFSSDAVTLAVWLRKAQLEAAQLDVADWSAQELRAQLDKIRALTKEADPAVFVPALQRIAGRAGVAVVVVRPPKGAALSGAALTGMGGRRIIALTARHLSDDHFWFTVFHEIAHLLLHGAEETFIDDFGVGADAAGSAAIEEEADSFARDALVPRGTGQLHGLTGRGPTKRDVLRLASRAGVAPGIVIGQLQHAGVLQFNQLNTLKRRYKWDGSSLRT
ncbi:ImmA/IrrE family metallo-endopeptidase [Agromyces intestinalis]|uniref:ImmA/IrrE family metallo-endopeptidase n=1 Tax=Agromyces intestinalis TaxID=2592652 RepID=A0A5C1YJQ9_9MICO|nr:ImmA/IrrE family metallo-endopeptidase [Agromyces intestinalis]QEO15062.1 ImmA/IrrE family metallo-endopeptidase [Agromyces intestinalis]